MTKKCPICAHHELEAINDYIDSDNYSYSDLTKILKAEFDLDVSNYQIRRHKLKHKNPNSTIITESKVVNTSLADFDKFLAEFGLSQSDLYNIEDSIDKIIGASQSMLINTYMLNMCLLKAKLESAIERKAPYPRDEIMGLQKIYDMLERNAGIKSRIDINESIKVLESKGYKIVEE